MWVTSWETERDGRYVDRKAREMTDYIRGEGEILFGPYRPSVRTSETSGEQLNKSSLNLLMLETGTMKCESIRMQFNAT